MKQYDLIIIGSGPAGLEVEGMLADPTKKIAVIEKSQSNFGGVCINQGCMPTKHLAKCADFKANAAKASEFNIDIPKITLDVSRITAGKNQLTSQLRTKHQGHIPADIIFGHGRFINNKTIEVTKDNGEKEQLSADKIVIATGSRPSTLRGIDTDGTFIKNSDHFLNNQTLPKNLLIIGGGVIGMEFASIYNTFGSKVTIVEAAPTVLPNEDQDTGMLAKELLEKKGIEIHTNLFIASAVVENNQVNCTFKRSFAPEIESTLSSGTFDQVLVAVGRTPNTDDLGLDNTDITLTKGFINVDEYLETEVKGVYAAGDIITTMMLAHTAVYEAMVITSNMKQPLSMKNNNSAVPRVVFTNPEIAGVGLTEREAKQQFCDIKVINFPMEANGKNFIEHMTDGRIKLIFSGEELTLVGASIIGKAATEVIHELTLAVTHKLTHMDLKHTIHAHPTTSEIIWFTVFKGMLADSTESYMQMMKEKMGK
jgi:dihydrolipoamide dehydrogenase